MRIRVISLYKAFLFANGRLLERTLAIQELFEDEMDAFISFIVQYYQENMIPSEILVPQGVPTELLEELLQTHVRIPLRGSKKALVDMVQKNAKEAHDQKFELALRQEQ